MLSKNFFLYDPDKIIGQREAVYRQAIMNFEIRQQ